MASKFDQFGNPIVLTAAEQAARLADARNKDNKNVSTIIIAKNKDAAETGFKADQAAIDSLKAEIKKLYVALSALKAEVITVYNPNPVRRVTLTIRGIYNENKNLNQVKDLIRIAESTVAVKEKELQTKRTDFYRSDVPLGPPSGVGDGSSGSGGGGGGGTSVEQPAPLTTTSVKYNLPAVKEAYLKSDMSLFNEAVGAGGTSAGLRGKNHDTYIYANNTATAISDASSLWNGVNRGSKGMIQTWTSPVGLPLDTLNSSLNVGTQTSGTLQRYGFQFLYNPGNITMGYGGVPDVDVSMYTSGLEKFNLTSSYVFKSTITFDIIINRMFDMKYLDSPGVVLPTVSTQPWPVPISGRSQDLKDIYNKGTMYDVEFLLQTILGVQLSSQLRGKTADIGFLSARPIELHLGKSLRYLVQISSFNLNHVIFDWRMVPLFTSLSITATRIPDYGSENALDGSK